MNVLLVTAKPPRAPKNGIGKFIQEFSAALKEQCAVKVFSLELDPFVHPHSLENEKRRRKGEAFEHSDWVDYHHLVQNDWYADDLESRHLVAAHAAIPQVNAILADFKPDIIYLHSVKLWWPFRYEPNVIVGLHSLEQDQRRTEEKQGFHLAMQRWERECAERSLGMCVYSPFMQQRWQTGYGPTEKMHLVSPGFNRDSPEPSKKPEGTIHIAFFGRLLNHQKGYRAFLDAAKRVTDGASGSVSVAFHVYGEGETDWVEEYPQVDYHGHVTGQELAQAFAQTHIVVMPSVYEPLGFVGLEAIAAGCLLLCTRGQGMDMYLNEHNHLPVNPDPCSIAERLETVLKNWPHYADRAQAAADHTDFPSWKQSVSEHLELFRQIVQN